MLEQIEQTAARDIVYCTARPDPRLDRNLPFRIAVA